MTDQTPTPDSAPVESPESTETPTPDAGLGEAGRKALDAERKARRDAERRAAEAQARTDELEAAERRRSVAADKGLTEAQAKWLRGSSREEMEAEADELLAAFTSPADAAGTRRLPRENLRPGAVPSAELPPDLSKVAAEIVRGS